MGSVEANEKQMMADRNNSKAFALCVRLVSDIGFFYRLQVTSLSHCNKSVTPHEFVNYSLAFPSSHEHFHIRTGSGVLRVSAIDFSVIPEDVKMP